MCVSVCVHWVLNLLIQTHLEVLLSVMTGNISVGEPSPLSSRFGEFKRVTPNKCRCAESLSGPLESCLEPPPSEPWSENTV